MLNIGGIELRNPFMLAPLAGITDAVMRSLYEELGAALPYTEMISAKGLYYGEHRSSSTFRKMPDQPEFRYSAANWTLSVKQPGC